MLRRFAFAVALLLTTVGPATAGPVEKLDDITTWVGAGGNRAALVVDGAPGGPSYVWGYRWDGAATGEDMLRAVAAADVGLYATLGTFDFGGGPVVAVLGFGIDVDRDGVFGVTPALTFVGGVATLPGGAGATAARAATDPGDFYREDFFSAGYYGYWLKATDAAPWAEAQTGPTDRVLADGAWDGYRFAPGFVAAPPGPAFNPVAPAAVPAPAGLVLAAAAGPVLLLIRRRG